ncbi:ATP-binding protein [Pseudocolwellia agarivorans]|uniref:ATP-binding protein n=1 Tax=Pseudocolwellia agarivorans TaxID=1911682 RepID=UPI0009873E6A|nr:ATP-binding protein [Pseudocolwellia agarivorans]
MQSNQKILPTRRTYNKLVANEMMEDFALRFTAKRARHHSFSKIAITALGIVSFLVLEAIGGAITLNYGFVNSAWAILAVVFVIFFNGLPISYYSAKYGVDIDLLSRGAGFGYIGSTIASLVYASFTFIFFALEAAVMSMALYLLFDLPLYIGYVISAVAVIPLVTHGIAYISKFQVWTQPIWAVLQVLPLFFVFSHADTDFQAWFNYTGNAGETGASFNLLLFGSASAVLLALVAQIGEQVDFLRFLPEKPKKSPWKWWLALVSAGPGWIIFGGLKLLLGSFLAYFALQQGVSFALAGDPAHMYNLAFSYVFDNANISLIVACSFVIISQLKINVANAYAGSLAWSNFFSRATHNHPGRVVWMLFNLAIALLLMELGIYQTIEKMLTVYSVVVLAWLSSVVADLIINKPLGISPKGIEFKRSRLHDINPVGVGSMIIATFVGFTAHFGWYGETVKALASFIAFGLPFITVPLIGMLTKGKFYLVNNNMPEIKQSTKCHICENEFEQEDMTYCPAYNNAICSLCCSLDVRCGDQCRPEATIAKQSHHFFNRFLTTSILRKLTTPLMQFVAVTLSLSFVGAGILFLIYLQVPLDDQGIKTVFANTLIKIFFLLLIIIGIVSWLFILARSGNRAALKELRSQTNALAKEIDAHKKTSLELQNSKEVAESANEAKSRYLAGLSHELRTPLNVLLGYAQLLSQDSEIPTRQRETLSIVKRNGEHLADLIEGLLEISKIEAGRITLQKDDFNLYSILMQLVEMFQMQASQKGIKFTYNISKNLPVYVATDKQRFRQILINLISNAIKYTEKGSVNVDVSYRNNVAQFSITDTGVGISKANQELVFKPFEQIRNAHTQAIGGTGLGLTISRSLAELMGGEITLTSVIGQGSTFKLRLLLSQTKENQKQPEYAITKAVSYAGAEKTILVVDDDSNQHRLMRDLLQPLGFNVLLAPNATTGFAVLESNTVDLMLLDVRMPETNGWQMAKQIRQLKYTLPIIMVSANARDIEANQQAEAFHNGYIAKPINIDSLLGKIAQCLSIEWQYENIQNDAENTDNDPAIEVSSAVNAEHYQSLIAIAEIGYLSGFKEQMTKIDNEFVLPNNVKSQLNEYVAQCNFPKIIQYLNELINQTNDKK